MTVESSITIFMPGCPPATFVLEDYQRDIVRLGRGPHHGSELLTNDISFDDKFPYVSRAQCSFVRDDAQNWRIVDESTHKTMVFNGRRVGEHVLSDGDKIYFAGDANSTFVIAYARRTGRDAQAGGRTGQGEEVQSYNLNQASQFLIGRLPSCNIVLSHPSVSRIHCIISYQSGSYYISDNESKNGIILNSQPLEGTVALNQMDRISIAGYSFIYSDGQLFSYEADGGVGITVSHLCKEVGKGDETKLITNDVNLRIEPNHFVAVIGGSGAGKTTLLNCLSGMTDFTYGEVLINGDSIESNGKSLRSLMGYVPQQDIVYDSLTLERMLWYSAQLRMPKDSSTEEIMRKIDQTLETVELTAHRSTMISQLSGGERKRASIAVELLAEPRLFFLDEPSSGLDPGTEKHLMQMLKRLAQSGKTVVMVTHTVQNLDLCDDVICMGKGGVLCYAGPPKDALTFFGKSKYADMYDDLNFHSAETAQRFARQDQTRMTAQREEAPKDADHAKKQRKGIADLFREFLVLTQRYVEIMFNSLPRLILLLVMPIVLTFLVCIAFHADGGIYDFLDSIFKTSMSQGRSNFPFLVAQDTVTLMFAFSCACFWTGMFNSVQEISKERLIYEREKFSGVGVSPYVFSKFVPLSVLCLVQSIIMVVILIFMSNTSATVFGGTKEVSISYGMMETLSDATDGVVLGANMMWAETLVTTFLCALSAMCLGLMISASASNEMALVLCPVCLMPQILFAGVVGKLTGVTQVISEIVTCKWSCVAYFVSARVNDLNLSCEYKNSAWNIEAFSEDNGGIYDAAYSIDKNYILGLNGVLSGWLAMALLSVICIVVAIVVLRHRRYKSR